MTSSPPDRPFLTAEGRRLLQERIRELAGRSERLRGALDDAERGVEVVEDYQRTEHELQRLHVLLENAGMIEEMPDNPAVVELGDTVTISLGDGESESYIIVDASEAPMDDRRISCESPLAQALLARHVGEEVEVRVPGGSYRCTIVRASRVPSSGPAG
jgi:transcription elongation factor GreA